MLDGGDADGNKFAAAVEGGDKLASALAGDVAFLDAVRVPTQFDEYKMEGGGNQCAFCAHQFALRSHDLLAAVGSADVFVAFYRRCMQQGTAHRQARCESGLALPVGENIDDPIVLQSVEITIRDDPGATDPHLGPPRIIRAASTSIFHQQRPMVQIMFPNLALASRIMASSDEARHPESSRAEFEATVRGILPGGVVVLERHMEAMTLVRTHDADPCRAFLICDSHATQNGLTSADGALQYVFRVIPRADFPLVYMSTTAP